MMVRIYCRAHHATRKHLCQDCARLVEYASKRIDACPLLDMKPTCAKCTIHCYERIRREQIRAVMRFSGPRMIYRHPIVAIRHSIDGRRHPPRQKAGVGAKQS